MAAPHDGDIIDIGPGYKKRPAAHDALIAGLVVTAKAQLIRALDSIPGEHPFTAATAFIEAKRCLERLESLLDAINDHRFAPFFTGASRAQVDQAQPVEANRAQGSEAEE